ncbi:MAG TPA: sensor histidine kinase [Symbiobacteriaceae bacterium]|nr:sensor histidine kinase [Symbiobacteriaceae bacterium]
MSAAEEERLKQQLRESEERYRSLALRLAETRGELETSLQRHLILHERNRIAQDLHDRAAQTHFLMKLKLEWVLDHMEPDSPLRGEIERLQELAAQATTQTREAIYALRASELNESGLAGGLRRLTRELQRDGLAADMTVSGMPVPLGPELENTLFKVAQEALNNARKHSHASAVMVSLRYMPGQVGLVVQDNGVGLPLGAEGAPGRLGLAGMRARVEAAGGRLDLLNDDDEGGLIVRVAIPIAQG